MARILVVRLSSLGDVTMTLPVVERLRQLGHSVHYITKAKFRPLLAAYGKVESIHTISDHASIQELRKKAQELGELKFDLMLDFHRNFRTFILSWLLSVPVRRITKFRLKEWVFYLFRQSGARKLGIDKINRLKEMHRAAGLDFNGIVLSQPLLSATLEDCSSPVKDWIAAHKKKTGFVCIAPESAWREKEWELKRFDQLAKKLEAQGFGTFWLGTRGEQPATTRGKERFYLLKGAPLSEVFAVIGASQGLIGNDSGLVHVADAFLKPSVAVFGPTTEELGFAPRQMKSRVAEAALWCRPCSKTGRACFRVWHKRKCLELVTVEKVYDDIRTVIAEDKS